LEESRYQLCLGPEANDRMLGKYVKPYWPVFLVGSSLLVAFYFVASPYQNCKRTFTKIALENNYEKMSAEHAEICRRKAGLDF
jgi:hypothetical protein